MRVTDPVPQLRHVYAEAIAPALGVTAAEALTLMDEELRAFRAGEESVCDKRWYASLITGTPDYGIYDDPAYLPYLWPSTLEYARVTVRWITRWVPAGQVTTVVDLGCGIGITTAWLSAAYPDASVYGTQLPGVQGDIAAKLAAGYRFRVIRTPAEASPPDPRRTLVLGSEYFEHFHDPVRHVRQVLGALHRPRWLAAANAFGARSAGHFPWYSVAAHQVSNRTVGATWGRAVRAAGYRHVRSAWNNRPALYECEMYV